MAGGTFQQMLMGGVAAVVPVVLRWVNSDDKEFGIGSK
jgi:hypothetical protein